MAISRLHLMLMYLHLKVFFRWKTGVYVSALRPETHFIQGPTTKFICNVKLSSHDDTVYEFGRVRKLFIGKLSRYPNQVTLRLPFIQRERFKGEFYDRNSVVFSPSFRFGGQVTRDQTP